MSAISAKNTLALAAFAVALPLGISAAQAAPMMDSKMDSATVSMPPMPVAKPFGTLANGQKVTQYTLTNSLGTKAEILDYGGIIRSLMVRDKNGRFDDVALGFDTLDAYVKDSPYFGALVGRYANRIAKGHFTLDGKKYTLATNNAPNHLHGGPVGFDRRVWSARPLPTNNGQSLELRLISPDGDQGYPGQLTARVLYTLNNQNELRVDYSAVTTAPTVCNLTQHSYFNLAGKRSDSILKHKLQINANTYLPIDKTSIPLGKPAKVAGTPFDFRTSHVIGARIGANNLQLKNGAGYDHNFVLNGKNGVLKRAALVVEPITGRTMTVSTTEPGLQFYGGNFLKDLKGKGGRIYNKNSGFALEAQKYPDSPNHPSYPSSVLLPGQNYRQTTIFAFSTR